VDRLFLDTNILFSFSAAYRADAGVARLWRVPASTLVTSEYAVEEARRNLSEASQLARLDELLESVERQPSVTLAPDLRMGIALREKDWPILGGAVHAGATHLITGDVRDFGPHFGKKLLGVLVQTPADYLAGP
jgi:predicted nucleic acid-binding protein